MKTLVMVTAVLCAVWSLVINYGWSVPDEAYPELKMLGLKIKGMKARDIRIMDRKPYTAFYAETSQYIETPDMEPAELMAFARKESVDVIILHAQVTEVFRPKLLPLLIMPNEILMYKGVTIAHDDIPLYNEHGIRMLELLKEAE